jgi:hypothetical protein
MSAMLRVDGSVTFWSLGDSTSLDALKTGLSNTPHPARHDGFLKYAPLPRTDQACLKDALAKLYSKYLIRPLAKRDGFAVLEEIRQQDDVQTVNKFSVTVDENGVVNLLRNWADTWAIRSELDNQRKLLRPAQVTACLVGVLSELGAVTLRPKGGIYWLPDSALPTWRLITDAVESSSVGGRNSVYKITHQFDGDSIRAVRDALLGEIERESERIMQEVDGGELGETALRNRAAEAESLQQKVREYERILGERLPDAEQLAYKAEMTATAAKVLASGAA